MLLLLLLLLVLLLLVLLLVVVVVVVVVVVLWMLLLLLLCNVIVFVGVRCGGGVDPVHCECISSFRLLYVVAHSNDHNRPGTAPLRPERRGLPPRLSPALGSGKASL